MKNDPTNASGDHKATNFGVVKKKNPRRVCSTRVLEYPEP